MHLPWIRELTETYRAIGRRACDLETFPTPGHCDDHICLYDRREKILFAFAGDSFMGAKFPAPNRDVNSCVWITTLRRLLELDIEILIEWHGHVRTLRPDSRELPLSNDSGLSESVLQRRAKR